MVESIEMKKMVVIRCQGGLYKERAPETFFRVLGLLANNVASLRERAAVEIYCSKVERVEKRIAEDEVEDMVIVRGSVS